MASKRMFALSVVDSDAFLSLPATAQNLYFHLNMRADDDGFVDSPRKIMRIIGANDGDMQQLIQRRYLLFFESGVIVIKHWRLHNTIKADRYKPTLYKEELELIKVKENKTYTEKTHLLDDIKENGSKVETQVRLGKVRLDKNSKDIVEQSPTLPYQEIINYLNEKADTRYRHTSNKTQGLIKARINEGFTLENFKTVIDKKTTEWKSDNKMSAYLRPETLFGTKFESYLNQKIVKPSNESGANVIRKAHDEKPPDIVLDPQERQRMINKIKGLDKNE